jgi:hypothetical protein
MQLLIDSLQETPASLRFAASVLAQLADLMVPIELTRDDKLPPTEAQIPSINGPSAPIVLHTHTETARVGEAEHMVTDTFHTDPAAVFGRVAAASMLKAAIVPAGTPDAPLAPVAPLPPAAVSAPIAPAVPTAVASDVANGTPTIPAASTESVITAGAVDKNGMPWDAKVHSESKALNADGTWRFRRNLDAGVKAAYLAGIGGAAPLMPAPPANLAVTAMVQAGLLGTPATAGALPVAPPPPAPEAPPAPVAPQPPSASVPVPNGVPLGVPNTAQPAILPHLGFRDFMSAVNKALTTGRLTQDQLTTACRAANVEGITSLASEPGRIGLVHAQIAHLLGAAA